MRGGDYGNERCSRNAGHYPCCITIVLSGAQEWGEEVTNSMSLNMAVMGFVGVLFVLFFAVMLTAILRLVFRNTGPWVGFWIKNLKNNGDVKEKEEEEVFIATAVLGVFFWILIITLVLIVIGTLASKM